MPETGRTARGLFLSPKTAVHLPPPVALCLEAVLFLGVGLGLALTGAVTVAACGVAMWAADRLLLALVRS